MCGHVIVLKDMVWVVVEPQSDFKFEDTVLVMIRVEPAIDLYMIDAQTPTVILPDWRVSLRCSALYLSPLAGFLSAGREASLVAEHYLCPIHVVISSNECEMFISMVLGHPWLPCGVIDSDPSHSHMPGFRFLP